LNNKTSDSIGMAKCQSHPYRAPKILHVQYRRVGMNGSKKAFDVVSHSVKS